MNGRIYACSVATACAVIFLSLIPAQAKNQTSDSALNVQRTTNPVMRVLLGDAAAENVFTAPKDFVVEDTEQTRLFEVPANNTVSVSFADGVYTATHNEISKTSSLPLRVTPTRLKRKVTVESFEKRPEWNPELNDNIFFGSVEVVYSEPSQKLMLVNVVPIERYVRGIAEAGDDNASDYLQALLTAARTYALYNIANPTKHAGEPYILDASDGDQVYRGAGFSLRAPNVVAAQKATKKQAIFYGAEMIIAPYFSQTDGRTRSWSEVWNGEYPWAQSVDDPCCVGEAVVGHGVGLSAAGARYFIEEKGWDWLTVLKYYYNGVDVRSAGY